MKAATLAIGLSIALCATSLTSCITETVSSTKPKGTMKTEGMLVRAPVDETWIVVNEVVRSMTAQTIIPHDGVRGFTTTIRDAGTTVFVEPKKDGRYTIVHVRSDSTRVAEDFRAAVQRSLAGY